uniref:(California timema) hypothetical protein n=1 Tax=Timema californicum TaxID=61474 RepID=A0A7R9J4S8_TIMCA|nr:unnamed protein product [Timema californicum]
MLCPTRASTKRLLVYIQTTSYGVGYLEQCSVPPECLIVYIQTTSYGVGYREQYSVPPERLLVYIQTTSYVVDYREQCSVPPERLLVYIQTTSYGVGYLEQCSVPPERLIVYIQTTSYVVDYREQCSGPPERLILANALVVLSSTAEDGEIEVRISVGLQKEDQLKAVEVPYQVFLSTDYDPVIRLGAVERFCRSMLLRCSEAVVRQFLCSHVQTLRGWLDEKLSGASGMKNEHQLVGKIGAWMLMGVMFSQLDPQELESVDCPITRAAMTGPVTTGKELIVHLTKGAFNARCENTPPALGIDSRVPDLFRRYQCTAYNTLVTIVSNTKRSAAELKFYQGFLFTENRDKNQLLWEKLVDCSRTYTFPMDWEEIPKRRKKMVGIRRMACQGGSSEVNYLPTHSQYLFDSTLREDVTQFDFTTSLVLSEGVTLPHSDVTASLEVTLESDSLNEHECMSTLCGLIQHMVQCGISPLPQDLNYFLIDIIAMLLSWHDVAIPQSSDVFASEILHFLIANIHHNRRDIFKHNLEVIKTLVEVWKPCLSIPKQQLLDGIVPKGGPDSRDTETGIQLVGVMLANDIHPWSETGKKLFLDKLLSNLDSNQREVYLPCAEVIGMSLKLLGTNLNIAQLLESDSSFLENVNNNFMPVILFHIKKMAGMFRVLSLEMIHSRLVTIQQSLYLTLVDVGLMEYLTNRESDVQELALKIVSQAAPRIEPTQLALIFPEVCRFGSHGVLACRRVMYEIAMWVYTEFRQRIDESDVEMSLFEESKVILLRGLVDSDSALQETVFNRSPSTRKRLHTVMEEMVLPVLELIQFVDTRWSSEYNMLSRLHAVRKAVGAELANSENNIEILTEVEWKQAAGIVEVLGPLADATKEISGDNKALKSRFSFYDSDPIFCPSMLCDPRFRGVLIDDMVAVNTLAIEVKKLSDKSSLEPNVKDEHPSCSSSSSGLWSSFDSIPNTTQPAIDNNSEVKDYLNEPRVPISGGGKRVLENTLMSPRFWNTDAHFPAGTAHRLITLLTELYSPRTEPNFLAYSTQLLLEATALGPDFSRKIFDHPLSACKFEDLKVLVSWRAQHTSIAPMFAETFVSQPNTQASGSLDMVVRATQTSLEFQPTLGQGEDVVDASNTSFSSFANSSLLFSAGSLGDKSRRTRRGDQQLDNSAEVVNSNPSNSYLRRRFLKDKEKIRIGFASREILRKHRREEHLKERAKKREATVNMYRSYRIGDLPDIEILHSALIQPLRVLAKRDSSIGRRLLVSLFSGILAEMGDGADWFTARSSGALGDILSSSTLSCPPVIGTVLEIALANSQHINLDVESITTASRSSGLLTLGSLLLEQMLMKGADEGQRPAKRARVRTDTGQQLWLKLADSTAEGGEIEIQISVGNAATERYFSVNKECLVENLHEDRLIAQRVTYDAVTAAGGILNMILSKKMIHAVANASGIRKEALQKKKIKVDLNEWDVVRGIFRDKVQCGDSVEEALLAEATGFWREARDLYQETLQDSECLVHDYCYQALYKCLAHLSDWDRLNTNVKSQAADGDLDQLWKDS